MNKIIVIFGFILLLIAGVAFYQYNTSKQQPQMKTNGKVTIGSHVFTVEVVKDSKAQQIGLTKYSSIQDNQGMLFVFANPGIYGFWMRGMKFPIDIVFINNNKVVAVNENLPPVKATATNIPIYQPSDTFDTALELQAGIVKKFSIKKGDTVKIEQ